MGRLTQSTAEIQEILDGYNALKEQVEKLAVSADGKTAWQNYQEWSELTDGFWQNEEAYNKYLSVRDGMCGIATKPTFGNIPLNTWLSWDACGFSWHQFVTIKDRNPEYAVVEDYSSNLGMYVGLKDEEGELWFFRINPNNETIKLEGY